MQRSTLLEICVDADEGQMLCCWLLARKKKSFNRRLTDESSEALMFLLIKRSLRSKMQ